jgi:hypothetical protein
MGVEIPTVSLQPCDRMRIRRRSACLCSLAYSRVTSGADINDLETGLMGMV